MQRILDPLGDCVKDEDGALMYTVDDKELNSFKLDNEEAMRAEYEELKEYKLENHGGLLESDYRVELFEKLENDATTFDQKDFAEVFDREMSIFKKDERYDYVKDMRDCYKDSLSKSTEAKIFETIPDHFFWDIKKPQRKSVIIPKNRYNPFRGREYKNFFEIRDNEPYIDGQHQKENRNDAVSSYRRY